MMDCKDMFLRVQDVVKSNVNDSLATSFYPKISDAFSFCEDYNLWVNFISENYSSELFKLASIEYETSITFSLQYMYKQSFSALRACLEHTLFGIQLSTNLLMYRLWKIGERDLYWAEIVSDDSGVFSNSYTKCFSPELLGNAPIMKELARRVYRECSEYIHGNYRIAGPLLSHLQYDESLPESFLDKAQSVRYILEYSFFVRYHEELHTIDVA